MKNFNYANLIRTNLPLKVVFSACYIPKKLKQLANLLATKNIWMHLPDL